jgi:hypothetical protein
MTKLVKGMDVHHATLCEHGTAAQLRWRARRDLNRKGFKTYHESLTAKEVSWLRGCAPEALKSLGEAASKHSHCHTF